MRNIKKYEFTGDVNEIGLKRIKRLSDGLVGGWIQSEDNLSHEGDCWVYGNALVYGDAWVYGNAKVYGNVKVYGNALVGGNAQVCDNAKVYDNAWVHGDARVYGDALVDGRAWVYGNAKVGANAKVRGDALVGGNAKVCGNAKVRGDVLVSGNAQVYGDAIASKRCLYIQRPKHNITITDRHIQIGCLVHTIEHWLTNLEEIGSINYYTSFECEQTKRIIEACIMQPITKGETSK